MIVIRCGLQLGWMLWPVPELNGDAPGGLALGSPATGSPAPSTGDQQAVGSEIAWRVIRLKLDLIRCFQMFSDFYQILIYSVLLHTINHHLWNNIWFTLNVSELLDKLYVRLIKYHCFLNHVVFHN